MATFFHVEILDGVPINQYENLFLQLQAKKCKISGWKTSKFNICKLVKKRSLKVGQLWSLQDIHGTEKIFPTAWKPFQPSAQSREMLVLPSNNFLKDGDLFLISLKNDLHLLFSTSLSWRLRSSMDLGNDENQSDISLMGVKNFFDVS